MANRPERLGTNTREVLYVLCYQHHSEMLPRPLSESAEALVYACQQAGCLIRYDGSHGYIIDTRDAQTVEEEKTPEVSCPNDGQHMYLAEVMPQRRSYRLWKCPECNATRTNEETVDGLGKSAEA
jgi:hypothetical protein